MTTDNTDRSVLVLGRNQLVIDDAIVGLRDLGYTAQARTDFADIPGLIVNQIQSAFAAEHQDPTQAPRRSAAPARTIALVVGRRPSGRVPWRRSESADRSSA